MTTFAGSLWRHSLVAAVSIVMASGCGGPAGPPRYRLEGSVTFQGAVVPKGVILLRPDTSAGNSGPGATAEIEQGRFATLEGMGHVGGPHLVEISAYDGVPFQDGPQINPMGKPLFMSFRAPVDLPREDGTRDFHLPPPNAKR